MPRASLACPRQGPPRPRPCHLPGGLRRVYNLPCMLRRFYDWLYPELARFPSHYARQPAREQITGLVFGARFTIAVLLCLCLMPADALLLPFVIPRIDRLVGGNVFVVLASIAILGGLPILAVTPLVMRLGRNAVRRMLRQRLRDEGITICIPCGYDLTTRAGDVCPECGHPHGLARTALPAALPPPTAP